VHQGANAVGHQPTITNAHVEIVRHTIDRVRVDATFEVFHYPDESTDFGFIAFENEQESVNN
jgi:hypothetical protein